MTSIDEKRKLFAIRNRMVDIPANFPQKIEQNKILCICKHEENMKHIYECKILESHPVKVKYAEVYNGNVHEQIEVMERFIRNFEKRNNMNPR